MSDNSTGEQSRRTLLRNAAVAPAGVPLLAGDLAETIGDMTVVEVSGGGTMEYGDVPPKKERQKEQRRVFEEYIQPELDKQFAQNIEPATIQPDPTNPPENTVFYDSDTVHAYSPTGSKIAAGHFNAKVWKSGVVTENDNEYYLGAVWGAGQSIDQTLFTGNLRGLKVGIDVPPAPDGIELGPYKPTGEKEEHGQPVTLSASVSGDPAGGGGGGGGGNTVTAGVSTTFSIGIDIVRAAPGENNLDTGNFTIEWMGYDGGYEGNTGCGGVIQGVNRASSPPEEIDWHYNLRASI